MAKGKERWNNKRQPPKSNANKQSSYDPLGSYTGRPADGGKPMQNSDDL